MKLSHIPLQFETTKSVLSEDPNRSLIIRHRAALWVIFASPDLRYGESRIVLSNWHIVVLGVLAHLKGGLAMEFLKPPQLRAQTHLVWLPAERWLTVVKPPQQPVPRFLVETPISKNLASIARNDDDKYDFGRTVWLPCTFDASVN